MSMNSSVNRSVRISKLGKHVLLNWLSHPRLSPPVLVFSRNSESQCSCQQLILFIVVGNCLLSFVTACAQSSVYEIS